MPGETLDWPTFGRFKFEPGDLVFFYASTPVLQMIGKLEIERVDLPFSEADPRNDLRKWPRHHSRIPWMRLRVLQSAPVPFKPLQRGSLYYHTEFKPSPYPKLLHEGEIEYVLRAFDEAMTYSADMIRYEGGIDPTALSRVTRGEILTDLLDRLKGQKLGHIAFAPADAYLTVELPLPGKDDAKVTFNFGGVKRVNWEHDHTSATLTGVRLTPDDTYLLFHFDGADLEILAETLRID